MYRAAMDSTGLDTKGSIIKRVPESAPADQLNNDRERACIHNLSWIKPQMMRQVLSFRDEERSGSRHGGSEILMDSGAPRLMQGLFPQPIGFAAPISHAANQKTTISKCTQKSAAPAANVQSQRWPFLSHGSPQTNATISTPASIILATAAKATTAPLTIFYNGTVSVYDVPASKAEAIMTLANTAVSNSKSTSSPTTTSGSSACTFISMAMPKQTFTGAAAQQQPTRKLNAGLPIARKQSLLRFLEKRKERVNSTSPYAMKTPESNEGCAGRSPVVSPTL